MRTLTLSLAASLALCAAWPAPVRGEDPSAGKMQAEVERLVSELGHDDFRTREAASRRLAELGEAARPVLERALAQTQSPEVTWRAEQLLRRLDGRKARPLGEPLRGPAEEGPAPAPAPGGPAPPAPDPDDLMEFMRRQFEDLKERLGGRLRIGQMGFPGRVEAPGLVLERRWPYGAVLEVRRTDAAGAEGVERYEGRDLADILRRNPTLEQHAGMAELKRRDAETSLPGFDEFWSDDFFKRRGGPRAAPFSGGFTFSTSEGLEIHQGPDGARVRVTTRGEDGKEEVKEYTGKTLDEIRERHPELAGKLGGLRVHVGPPTFFGPGVGPRRLEPAPPATPGRQVRFGVLLAPVDAALALHLKLPRGQGALVEAVVPDSTAARLGVEALDVIVALDGEPVTHGDELAQRLRALAQDPALPVRLEVIRAGARLTLSR